MNSVNAIWRNNAVNQQPSVPMKQLLRRWFGIGVALAILFTSGCQPTEVIAKQPVTIKVAGATAMQPVLYALTSEFSRQHPHVFFDIAGGGSTIGEERLWQGQVDLAASTLISPTLPPPGLTTLGQKLQRIPIGLDGLTVIVHTDNPLTNLTLRQLQALYSGREWNWQNLGWRDADVVLITREGGSGSRTLFDERVMGELPTALTAIVMPTSADVVDYVATHPPAIGYVSRAYVVEEINEDEASPPSSTMTTPTDGAVTPRVKLVAIENQLPTMTALHEQSYHLIQPLYLVSQPRPRDWVKQFIEFALSPQGQAIVARYHLPLRHR